MPRTERATVRLSPDERAVLARYERVADMTAGALLREVTLAFGPVWIANRAADRVAGRPVLKARRGHVQAVRGQVP